MKIDNNYQASIPDIIHDIVDIANNVCLSVAAQKPKNDFSECIYGTVARCCDKLIEDEDLFKLSHCKAGCSHCCTLYVDTLKGEAKTIAKAVASMKKSDAAEVIDRIKKNAVLEKNGVDEYISAKQMCAFVDPETQRCIIYPVRPVACRVYDSHSVDDCISVVGNPDGEISRTPKLVYYLEVFLGVLGLAHMKFGLSGKAVPLHTNVLKEINALKRK